MEFKGSLATFFTQVSNEGNNHTNKWRDPKANVNEVFVNESKVFKVSYCGKILIKTGYVIGVIGGKLSKLEKIQISVNR